MPDTTKKIHDSWEYGTFDDFQRAAPELALIRSGMRRSSRTTCGCWARVQSSLRPNNWCCRCPPFPCFLRPWRSRKPHWRSLLRRYQRPLQGRVRGPIGILQRRLWRSSLIWLLWSRRCVWGPHLRLFGTLVWHTSSIFRRRLVMLNEIVWWITRFPSCSTGPCAWRWPAKGSDICPWSRHGPSLCRRAWSAGPAYSCSTFFWPFLSSWYSQCLFVERTNGPWCASGFGAHPSLIWSGACSAGRALRHRRPWTLSWLLLL